MSTPVIETINTDGLDIFINSCDIRRDLHAFINYVRLKRVKRGHRNNNIPKGEVLKLAKILKIPEKYDEVKEEGYSRWIDEIDTLALKMGFIKYDTEGEYIGYTSSEPSYPDNYIEFQEKSYNKFLESTIETQERFILDTLLIDYKECNNEFFRSNVFSRIDRFDSTGCATGALPTLNFATIRNFLLEILSTLNAGIWYNTTSFIAYLKKNHPFFLIPEKFKVKYKYESKDRYGNFRETSPDYKSIPIEEGEPDAFERVEGRYVERFIEGIPLMMNYLDVAYGKGEEQIKTPSLNSLKAFRINERFLSVMNGVIADPKVVVQPNFEIHVDSQFYPAKIISALTPLTDIITEDRVTIMKLRKDRVAAELVKNESLDLAAFLKELSGRELPQNISIELEEWAGHSDAFILYENAGLWEGDLNSAETDGYIVETINPKMRIVRNPYKLYRELEEKEHIPYYKNHQNRSLSKFPESVRTLFSTKDKKVKSRKKSTITLKRETKITLSFPSTKTWELFRKALLLTGSPFESNAANNSITFLKKYESTIKEVVNSLKSQYIINIQDL